MAAEIDFTARILDAHLHISPDPRSADHSWEHCYRFFSAEPKDLGLASLHLAFYLASWGMYRGSAAIRNFDYLVHMPVVELLLQERFRSLRGATPEVLSARFEDLLWPLVGSLYEPGRYYPSSVQMTDTLVTKILLGTLGCLPAYDRYLKAGLREHNINMSASEGGLRSLLAFCDQEAKSIAQAQEEMHGFSPMRVMDVYFHQLGREVLAPPIK